MLQLHGDTMGTTWHVTLVDLPPGLSESQLQKGIEVRLDAVNQSMSTYLGGSEINRFNALEPDTWFVTSPDFYSVLTTALEIGSQSDGAYDVTVAPLVALWGFGADGLVESPPAPEAIAKALQQVGQTSVQLDPGRNALMKERALSLDFSSLAKGYGVDQVALWLQAKGVSRYLVEVGGEMRLSGLSARGDLWRIAIEQPDSRVSAPAVAVRLSDAAVATSGDYRNFFEIDGQRFSHSIDPRTGYPVAHDLVSVTVIHPQAMVADAWATALIVLGAERAMAVAEAHGLAVYFIRRAKEGFAHSHTSAFSIYLEQSDLQDHIDPGSET